LVKKAYWTVFGKETKKNTKQDIIDAASKMSRQEMIKALDEEEFDE